LPDIDYLKKNYICVAQSITQKDVIPIKQHMEKLKIKKLEKCKYASVSLGEVMLRLDPGEGRVNTARHFSVWEGGGEYNVARGLRKCFRLPTAVVTAFADNAVGRLLEDLIMQGGVDVDHIKWVPFDGIGRTVRNGLNFTERGFGIRGALGVSDRGLTAASQLTNGDIDWEHIFGTLESQWFHTGGIFAALSETTPEVIEEAMISAKKHGTIISYDLNYRPSLWKTIGGIEKAQKVNRKLAQYVDVMIGNEEDFTASLGFNVEGVDDNLSNLDLDSYKNMILSAVKEYPNFKAVATTLRTVKTATVNSWGGICYYMGQFHEATHRPDLEILDRVGGGDSFASGLIYGLMTTGNAQEAVEYGAAHGALAMTTAGDTSMATLEEVQKVKGGGSARVDR
jgi:2-dehydro-3-deoxygluconokinase